jgi:hypothetical protein
MGAYFTKESFPLTLVISLIVFAYISFFSVIIFG